MFTCIIYNITLHLVLQLLNLQFEFTISFLHLWQLIVVLSMYISMSWRPFQILQQQHI